MSETKVPQGILLGAEQSGELPADDVVPASFTADAPKKPAEVSLKDPKALESMKNKEVIVYANGIEYRGVLQGSDGEELYLRTELRYVTVLLDRVTRLVLADAPKPPMSAVGVDPSFFTADDDTSR